MCTVFAGVRGHLASWARATPRENIANGVIESVVARVAALAAQMPGGAYFLTGGLCDNVYVVERLAARLGKPVDTCPEARFAGALGAALCALELRAERG